MKRAVPFLVRGMLIKKRTHTADGIGGRDAVNKGK